MDFRNNYFVLRHGESNVHYQDVWDKDKLDPAHKDELKEKRAS